MRLPHHPFWYGVRDSSLSHSQRPQLRTVSLFQLSWIYKQANLSQIILYRLCSCLNNISSTSLHLTTSVPAAPAWMFHAQMRRLVPEVLRVCLQRGRKFLLCKSTCPAPNMPAKRPPQVATSQVCPVPVIVTTSVVFVYFTSSLWRSFLLLWAWTTIWYHNSSRDWTPLWHGYCLVPQFPA